MNWLYATIYFPAGRLTPGFIEQYIGRYSIEITGPQSLNGQWMTLEPTEENQSLSIIYVDNPRLAMFRKASVYDGTLRPEPVYDPPLAESESPESREPVGYIIPALWPENFLADIRRDPQPEPEFFEGVYVVEDDA